MTDVGDHVDYKVMHDPRVVLSGFSSAISFSFVLTMKSVQVLALLSCLLPIFAAPSSGEQRRAFPSSTKKGLGYNTAQYTVTLHLSILITTVISF